MNPRIQKPTASAQDGWEFIADPGRARALGLDPIPWPPSNEPHVRVRSVWLEAPLDDDWCIALQIAAQDGQPVVSELRIFPAEPPPQLVYTRGVVQRFSYPAGEWNGRWTGIDAKVPKRGLSSTIARRARVPLHAEYFEDIRQALLKKFQKDFFVDEFGFSSVDPRAAGTASRTKQTVGPGRPALPISALLPIAEAYADAVARGSRRPLKDLARRSGRSVDEIRRRVHQARRRGLLTRAAPGAAGGALTPEALVLLGRSRRRAQSGATSRTHRKRKSTTGRGRAKRGKKSTMK